jgi:hypothetical protein
MPHPKIQLTTKKQRHPAHHDSHHRSTTLPSTYGHRKALIAVMGGAVGSVAGGWAALQTLVGHHVYGMDRGMVQQMTWGLWDAAATVFGGDGSVGRTVLFGSWVAVGCGVWGCGGVQQPVLLGGTVGIRGACSRRHACGLQCRGRCNAKG